MRIRVPYAKVVFGVPPVHRNSSFDNFNAQEAHLEIVKQFVKEPFNLLIYGPPGVGKTHFLVSLYKVMVRKYGVIGGMGPNFVVWPVFLQEYKASMGEGADEVCNAMLNCSILFLDDVSVKMSDFERNLFARVIVDRYDSTRTIVVTSNDGPEGFASLLGLHEWDRFRSQLTVMEMQGESRR